jgi:hypothetical protein
VINVAYSPAPGSAGELARFAALQEQLRKQFLSFREDPAQPYTAVVVPSQSVDPVELAKIPGVAHYEERSLFNLMLLRHPRLRVVYVTSKRLDPLVVDYYLHQMRGVPSEHARRRMILLDCDDASARPLTAKLLERPLLLERVKAAIGDPQRAHLAVFNSTPLERTLSVQLGIPLNACDPQLIHLGSKTGARQVFKAAGVPLLPGREDLRDPQDLAAGIVDLRAEVPDARRIVVKLNDSFSGEGNALFEVGGLPAGASADRILEALPGLKFEAAGQTWEGYADQFSSMGGICELWAEGKGKTSPSVQLRVNPLREVQALSTHEQVLGGPSGQVFMGATFPANEDVRLRIQALGLEAGRVLAERGVIGRFAVDFLAVPDPSGEGPPALHALEINLRSGGTTHPFNTLKFITDGRYDEATGVFTTAQGQPRCYFATDALSAPEYRGILPFDLLDRLVVEGIHFRSDETGVVFHLLGCLSEYGKLGCVAIAPTLEAAKALHDETVRLLDDMSGKNR